MNLRFLISLSMCVGLWGCGRSEPELALSKNETGSELEETPPVETAAEVLPAEPWALKHGLLTDPILQLPGTDSVRVVWFTDFEGQEHFMRFGPQKEQRVAAQTVLLPRMLEDAKSELSSEVRDRLGSPTLAGVRERQVWRHHALAIGLRPGERVPYEVESVNDVGRRFRSDAFTLQPLAAPGQPTSILLTSDQQNLPMSAANYEMVVKTAGQPDAVLFAGDFVDHPNRASEWFDRRNQKRPPFYPSLQGRLDQLGHAAAFRGGAILQHAPLLGTIGNHDISGRWRPQNHDIATMFTDTQPDWFARLFRADTAADHYFETVTYDALWDHPETGPQGERYWAYRYGDAFIISLHVNRIWRLWGDNRKGKLCEDSSMLKDPDAWGLGDHVFDDFGTGSKQYEWLQETLQSAAFREAKYKIVMAHQTMFGLGENAYPVLASPEATFVYDRGQGDEKLTLTHPISKEDWGTKVQPVLAFLRSIDYHYPVEKDIWKQEIEPLLLKSGVQLVLCGHSHLWNRARVRSMNYLETSNVGNSFGARYEDKSPGKAWAQSKRPPGDPHDRPMIPPNRFNPMQAWEGYAAPLPFVASNHITVFSIFSTEDGEVKSYAFDTTKPESDATLIDVFTLGNLTSREQMGDRQ